MSIFTIPGNIKQQILPFVVNPNAKINQFNATAANSEFINRNNIGPQWFSFKYNSSYYPGGLMRIQICPSSLTNPIFGNYFTKDISYKLLYCSPERDADQPDKISVQLDDIFYNLPTIQIREFLPDAKLDQLINLVSDMFKGLLGLGKMVIGGVKGLLGALSTDQSMSTNLKMFREAFDLIFDFFTGELKAPNFFVNRNAENRFQGVYESDIYESASSNNWNDIKTKVINFPFLMYYRLQSTTTTNVYELPAMLGDKMMMSSEGSHGWKGGKGIGVSSLSDGLLGKIPMLKKIVDNMLGNIQINWMPMWNPEDGSAVEHPKIQVKFNLYNDTAEAALHNFIFVNTIVPNNMFIQYGLFQHSSSLYDVRISGMDRMYACSGNASVQYIGILRTPPPSWIKTLVSQYANSEGSKVDELSEEEKSHLAINRKDELMASARSMSPEFMMSRRRARSIEKQASAAFLERRKQRFSTYGKEASKDTAINKNRLEDLLLRDNIIKIPDIYQVTLEFTSLLPNNFNSYLFNWENNYDMNSQYDTHRVYQSGALNGGFSELNKVGDDLNLVVDAWINSRKENMLEAKAALQAEQYRDQLEQIQEQKAVAERTATEIVKLGIQGEDAEAVRQDLEKKKKNMKLGTGS